MRPEDLIQPPIYSKVPFEGDAARALRFALDRTGAERDRVILENNNMRRLLNAILTATGNVAITNDTVAHMDLSKSVRTVYDSRIKTTIVSLE